MNKHSVTIEKVIKGGYGLGKLSDGRRVMIPRTLPGEVVTFKTIDDKKTYLLGKLLSVDKKSDSRITPPCRYYKVCGGCDIQHCSYEEQLRIKTDIVINNLTRQQSEILTEYANTIVLPTLPSPETFHYRQRIRLWVDEYQNCGFRKHKSHEIVPISECAIAGKEINETLAELNNHQAFQDLLNHSSEVELLWHPATGKVTALLHYTRKPRPTDFKYAAELCTDIESLERLFFQGEAFPLTVGAPAECSKKMQIIYEDLTAYPSPLSLSWEVGGFCQVNLQQNKQLIDLVLQYADIQKDETVLDLFCGSGNFSIALAAAAKSLTGIEGQGAAIRSAKANASTAGLTNTTFKKSPIHKACNDLVAAGESFDCLVVDPPRQGMPGLAKQIASLCIKRMVYISCDPATLSRDIADLTGTGFSVIQIQPVDMFPQTHHIETVVLLEKN
ncbi:23S rRNA (uracil(1939)-C(5))-methyltransferase RlmD [Desulfosediminicola flagellatus]|uniref:23S rRNA (uracil(1939)-C(5))-methyltransferase RlmD n=1 Tax=Desulfosediminicola flagellatus TaxID=2569541 RepID=UPI0010AD3938|nr:23S rRNA (uracil(1939)-C(5))-methyltransferase RlmD [Desulfosediminicola flagellatus]